ncbi:MAG: tetratricopeptide repeat protein [Isosphaeraceae bacterium]
MYEEWAGKAPPEKRDDLEMSRLLALAEAAKFDRKLVAPRRQLLAAAMLRDEMPEGIHWAKEVLTVAPDDADANYALAVGLLEERNPRGPDVQRHLEALEAAKAAPVRLAWIKARLAQVAKDTRGLDETLAKARSMTLLADASPIDHAALFRLRALDVESTTETVQLPERVKALQAEARTLLNHPAAAPNRVMRLSLVLERVQKSLSALAGKADPVGKAALNGLVDAIDTDVEEIFQQALKAARTTDLHVYLTYADHLRFRGKREKAMEVVADGLNSPLATRPTSADVVLALHAVAVETALADTKDATRHEKAAPHIKELLASTAARYQGLGHLFQGAIDLEESGISGTVGREGSTKAPSASEQARLRASALNHLKVAAEKLPDVVEAQARYGVALVLSNEREMGRQYLQNALRLGNADPRFQIWAAWSMVQGGYPEEAEPVVKHLISEAEAGRLSPELKGTLHLLGGEIHQARKSPEDLKKALAEYERSNDGKSAPAGVQLRMAQIEVQLGQPDRALARLEQLKAKGQGSPSAEHLAVLTLLEVGKKDEATARLAAARKAYPDSDELVGLESALLNKAGKSKEADAILAAFLESHPDNLSVTLLRASVLADLLDDVKEARRLLINVAERSENSAPLVQLALLDMRQKDYPAVATSIAKIRARWKDAAAADLLDAQLALDQGKLAQAAGFFDAALKKDPGNKVVQFWKAQIDGRMGDTRSATRILEAIARDGSTKQLDAGVTLTNAAQSALANLALRTGEVGDAIRRFESLRSTEGPGALARADRWQLTAAYAAKGDWPAARRELAALLNDKANPASNDERVRAANLYRQNKETAAAHAQFDYVLAVEPTHAGAVVSKAYALGEEKKSAEAVALLRKSISQPRKDGAKPPGVLYLLLAGLESATDPNATASDRAMKALDEGLAAEPGSIDLVRAKYLLLSTSKGAKEAVAFVESQAAGKDEGPLAQLLVDVYREQGDEAGAESSLRALVAKNPEDVRLASALVRVVASQADRAASRNDTKAERDLRDKAAGLIRSYRQKFPEEPVFLQYECDLAFKGGDLARAAAITKEIDAIAKNSPIGPVLRARLFAAQGRPVDAAAAFAEALERDPAQPDVRLMLAQTQIDLGRFDEAVQQARLVRQNDAGRLDAVLIEARALSQPTTSRTQTDARRSEALALLDTSLRNEPKFSGGYHQKARILAAQGRLDDAAKVLKAATEAVPDDATAVAQWVELLSGPGADGRPATPGKIKEAESVATAAAGRDKTGELMLAAAIGFHKAGQFNLAVDWGRKAATKLDTTALHINYGDILLTAGERTRDASEARPLFEQAVEQYDKVLAVQANSVEAINNKAWILHTYLGESPKALAIANALLGRVDPSTLPGEFFDTLGAIQEGLGQAREAEDSYGKGLRKTPDHPVLNFHMGKLVAADPKRAAQARGYLQKALDGRDRLPPNMAEEVNALMAQVR